MGTWQAAGGIALGAVGSNVLAGQLQRFLPDALKNGAAAMVVGPITKALSGALLGWGASLVGFKRLGKSLATGGMVIAAVDVVGKIGAAAGIPGLSDYIQLSDYVQLQGLGTQAQVEAGVFGHSEEEMSAAQTFGPTF